MTKDIFDRILDEEYLRLVNTIRLCEEQVLVESTRLDIVVSQLTDICQKLSDEVKVLKKKSEEHDAAIKQSYKETNH